MIRSKNINTSVIFRLANVSLTLKSKYVNLSQVRTKRVISIAIPTLDNKP